MKVSMIVLAVLLGLTSSAFSKDLLVQFKNPEMASQALSVMSLPGPSTQVENLKFKGWIKISNVPEAKSLSLLKNLGSHPDIAHIQPDYPIRLLNNYRVNDPKMRAKLEKHVASKPELLLFGPKDNPDFPKFPVKEGETGRDPKINKQWGLEDIGAEDAWAKSTGSDEMIVAVIDTGVDYTHEDLIPNLWTNEGELGLDDEGNDKSTNGIDDDGNGYADDVLGWDFARDDNKPYDLYTPKWKLFLGGGNPGHGTHCAGNIAARGDNGIGIAGVAPNVKIMSLRFLTENGQGTTSAAIKAIAYAIDNGAMVMNNSWGSSGENPAQEEENKALRDIITASEEAGRLFIAAAGNSSYDNDSGDNRAYPASYENENIISVAAIDSGSRLGSFSSYGKTTVDLAAPGVRIYSTVPNNGYSDTVANLLGLRVFWDGTSMAAPHVAGAAAWYWSLHPELTALEVKKALLEKAEPVDGLKSRVFTGGKLSLKELN